MRKVYVESDGMSFAIEMLSRVKKAGTQISKVPISYHQRTEFSKLSRFEDGFDIFHKILEEAFS